jgi:4-hydroxy-tetrahydrodipicolinate reductase
VPIHSQRLPGVDSRQEVVFGGDEELLVIRHEAQGPRAFGPGILASLRYASRATGVARGLEHALDLLER